MDCERWTVKLKEWTVEGRTIEGWTVEGEGWTVKGVDC